VNIYIDGFFAGVATIDAGEIEEMPPVEADGRDVADEVAVLIAEAIARGWSSVRIDGTTVTWDTH